MHYSESFNPLNWDQNLFLANDLVHQCVPNRIFHWLGTDTNENYIINQTTINNLGYTSDSITYKLNDHGFRSKDFLRIGRDSQRFKILVSGCSHTFGIGTKLEETWPELLSSRIPNSVIYNIALLGQSADYVVRSIYKTINYFKPDLVAVLWPGPGRFEFPIHNQLSNSFCPWNDAYPLILADTEYQKYAFEKNKSMIELVCQQAECNLVQVNYSQFESIVKKFNEPARDLIHYGPVVHNQIASVLYNQYDKFR